jgi:hypothetical protein
MAGKVFDDVGVFFAKSPVPKCRRVGVYILSVSVRVTCLQLDVCLPLANNHKILLAAVPEMPDVCADILLSLLDILFQLLTLY